jgi:hypothetical protein
MEADDIALPERLAVQLEWMRRTGVDICGSCVKRFGEINGLLWFPETQAATCYELLFNCALAHPSVLMQANILKAHPYDEQAVFMDYEMWTRLVLRYHMGNVQQVLLKYRRHPHQTSVVRRRQVGDDLRKYRRRYFYALFPQVTEEDYAALARVADKEPLSNLADLERAGTWLLRLAQTSDRFLRERMARRWWATCRRSTHLGLGCYRLYRQRAPQFGLAIDEDVFALWGACALRLRAGSQLYKTLARLKMG